MTLAQCINRLKTDSDFKTNQKTLKTATKLFLESPAEQKLRYGFELSRIVSIISNRSSAYNILEVTNREVLFPFFTNSDSDMAIAQFGIMSCERNEFPNARKAASQMLVRWKWTTSSVRAKTCVLHGHLYTSTGEFDKATAWYQMALLDADEMQLPGMKLHLANSYLRQGKYFDALQVTLEAKGSFKILSQAENLTSFDRHCHSRNYVGALSILGSTYTDIGNHPQAINVFLSAIRYSGKNFNPAYYQIYTNEGFNDPLLYNLLLKIISVTDVDVQGAALESSSCVGTWQIADKILKHATFVKGLTNEEMFFITHKNIGARGHMSAGS